MKQRHPQIFKHRTWAPSELQALSGLSPVALRDLRRRDIAPQSEGRKLKLDAIAQLYLLSELTAHGFGPKSIKQVSEEFAHALRQHALEHRSAWADDQSYAAWLNRSASSAPKVNLILIDRAGEQGLGLKDLSELQELSWTTVSIVDLEKLGSKLAQHLARRPSALANTKEAHGL